MRFSLLAAVVLVTGCDWEFPDYSGVDSDGWWMDGNMDPFLRGEPEGFQQESTLWADTQGVAMDSRGQVGGAAMSGVTCQVDISSGYVGADVDPDWEDDESIVDAEAMPDGGVIGLAVTDRGFHLIAFDDWESGVIGSFDIPVLDVRFTDDGFASIHNDGGACMVEWLNPRGDVTASQGAAGNCRPGFAMATDAAFVNTTAGLNRVTENSAEVIAESADLVAWDASLDLLYTATSGSNAVSALRADGELVWTTQLEGAIADLEAVAARGAVFVSVEYPDLSGGLVMLDGATGAEIAIAQTVSAARDIELSVDGTSLAAAVPGQVHYLRVE